MTNALLNPFTKTVTNILNQATNSTASLTNFVTQVGTFIFDNNQQKTPIQVLSAFGSNAASLLALLDAYCAFLTTQTGVTVFYLPTGVTYTANNDGTVTLTGV